MLPHSNLWLCWYRDTRAKACPVGNEKLQHLQGVVFECLYVYLKYPQVRPRQYSVIFQVIVHSLQLFLAAQEPRLRSIAVIPSVCLSKLRQACANMYEHPQ